MTAFTDDELTEIVRTAWCAALPDAVYDVDCGWAAAGADSLKALHLVFRLEEALGRRVSYDLLDRETTPRRLALALAGKLATPRAPGNRTQVFLLPGLFGDEPNLADFRRAFAVDVAFHLLELPGLEVETSILTDLAASGNWVAQQIDAVQPYGPIRLAGFSFGGALAYETAHALQARGREIAFLGLLDAFPGGEMISDNYQRVVREKRGEKRELTRLLPQRGESFQSLMRRYLFSSDKRLGPLELLRRTTVAEAVDLDLDARLARRREVIGFCRSQAMRHYKPSPLDAAALLVVSDDGRGKDTPSRWSTLIPRLQTVHVPGSHSELFEPLAIEVFRSPFLARLQGHTAKALA